MTTQDISTESLKESFQTSRKFYDDKNYPRGMSRSGDYSIKEVTILEKYGVALTELAGNKRSAKTKEEESFQAVCRGEIKPSSLIEKTWFKYQQKTLTPKNFHTLFGSNKVNNQTTNEESVDSLDLDNE